ncbi:MAG: 3-deoxy-manno-octulosonate cytidylyltransferase [Nitrospinota bacterium]
MNNHSTLVLIPARFGSTRLKGKPLRLLNNRPLVLSVADMASKIKSVDKIIIATDHEKIFNIVTNEGFEAVMTSPLAKSGTDRIGEVARKYKDSQYIVNLQSDEPFFNPADIERALRKMKKNDSCNVASLYYKSGPQILNDKNIVKVVVDKNSYALYFSRAPIPYDRDGDALEIPIYKHIGIYIYRRDYLMRFLRLKESTLERVEKLEQLRILEDGEKIFMIESKSDSIGIDTETDLKNANKLRR